MRQTLRLWEIEVPFRRPLRTATGEITARHSVILALDTDGVTGWAEAPGFPSGRAGTAADAFDDLADPAGWIQGRPGVPIAAAALQAVDADAAARSAGIPLHALLGSDSQPVVARHPIGISRPGELRNEATWIQTHGILAVKVKVQPGDDVAAIAALRQALPRLDIGLDANGSYERPDDPRLAALDDLDVSFIEQPFGAADLAAHAELRARLRMAVCLDESISDIASVHRAIEAGAADQVAIKLNRMGLTALREVLAMCRPQGVGVQLGGTFDTTIGRLHLLAAAGLPGVVDAAVGPPSGYLASDLAPYPPLVGGLVAPGDAAGIGVHVDVGMLDEIAERSTSVTVERDG